MKLKIILTIIIITTVLYNCKGQKKDLIKMETVNKYEKDIDKRAYYLNYDLFMTYDIYLNDIKIEYEYQAIGSVYGMGYLNEYILNSGTQRIRLISKDLFPGKTNMPTKIFEKFNMEVYTADENDENIEKVKIFDFPDIPTPKPYFFDNTWTFEAKVPFNLEGWKNGKDLTKIDEKELEKMVLEKFKHYHELLNDGDVDQFMKENKKNFEDFVIANYYQKGWSEYNDNIRETISNQKGKMLPLKNYKIKIYGNGKLVTLERIEINETYYGRSALMAVWEEKNKLYDDYILLYMPKDKNTLEPIRAIIDYDIYDYSK
ncbi:hypothetical protein PJW08_00315 (plasmid) [Tenacibaculum finnmarkense]|nr:hypothetical protein PJW08_00315 [Tenacibaculum finnmarkense]